MIVYLALAAYLVAFILAVLLFVAGKNSSVQWKRILLAIHLSFLICFLVSFFTNIEASIFRTSFLWFVCSGLVAGGLILRSQMKWLKGYFAIFFLTLGYFLYSPSGFAHFLLTANPFAQPVKSFHLKTNYYLEQQGTVVSSNQHPYKLVQQFGVFHKTIKRDIHFTADPDSVKVIEWKENEAIVLRIYIHTRINSELLIDSTDIHLPLQKEASKNQIERRF